MRIVPTAVIEMLSGISLPNVYNVMGQSPLTEIQIADRILWENPNIGELRAAMFDVKSVGRHLETLIARGHAESVEMPATSDHKPITKGFYLTNEGIEASLQYQ